MSEKDLAQKLVRNAVAKQKHQRDEYTEANEDLDVKAFGNAAIANSLEFLGKHRIVTDVQPTFSQRGIGFAYRIDQALIEELSDDESISNRIDSLFEGSTSETASTETPLASANAVNLMYFADTNILLRFLLRNDPAYLAVRQAVRILKTRRQRPVGLLQPLTALLRALVLLLKNL
jgi:hypothetical protein